MTFVFGRRETAVGVLMCTLVGLTAFAWRQSRPHSGASSFITVMLVGIAIWVLPLIWIADRNVRRSGPTGLGYIVIAAGAALFVATRASGHFAAIWLVVTAFISMVAVAALRLGFDELRRRRLTGPAEPARSSAG